MGEKSREVVFDPVEVTWTTPQICDYHNDECVEAIGQADVDVDGHSVRMVIYRAYPEALRNHRTFTPRRPVPPQPTRRYPVRERGKDMLFWVGLFVGALALELLGLLLLMVVAGLIGGAL